jgi:hypothetical protein
MFPFDSLGWNLLNVMLLFQAVCLADPADRRLEAIQLTGVGLITTTAPSNGPTAALMVLGCVALEQNRLWGAGLSIALGALVKLLLWMHWTEVGRYSCIE